MWKRSTITDQANHKAAIDIPNNVVFLYWVYPGAWYLSPGEHLFSSDNLDDASKPLRLPPSTTHHVGTVQRDVLILVNPEGQVQVFSINAPDFASDLFQEAYQQEDTAPYVSRRAVSSLEQWIEQHNDRLGEEIYRGSITVPIKASDLP